MKQKKVGLIALSCLWSAFWLSSCSDSEDIVGGDDKVQTVYQYDITADVTSSVNTSQTRSMVEDPDNSIRSTWEKGDQIIAYRLNDNDQSKETQYSLLASTSAGQSSPFDGMFKTTAAISTTDELCFFYPGAASGNHGKTIVPVSRKTGDGKQAPLVYYEQQPAIKHQVELNISKQDGTIATIGKKFDYQWAKVKPTSVNGTNVKVEIGHMQRKIAIWGMRFADKNGKILTNIDSLSISNVKALDVLDLGTGEFVTDNSADETNTIVLTPAGNGKFTSDNGKYTYAALLPGTYTDVMIMAYVGNTCYYKTYSSVTFGQDNVYRTNVLGMEVAEPKSYVDVQGIKWATGNFIHYSKDTNYPEYWGIAPTQWWISDYAMTQADGSVISSQFIQDAKSHSDDLDLFRYGSITKALNVSGGDFKSGIGDISKKFYVGSLAGSNTTTDETKASYGDIVWFYTRKNNQKYRMPNKDEMATLFDKANAIPAYCYTEKGNKIYGAYFYTNKGESRIRSFPTKVNALYKYSDVTSLVKANMGLFLPITGRRTVLNDKIGFRDMTYGGGAYGQYMTSNGDLDLSQDLFFGPTEWNFSPNGKGQSKAIRPVWDESSTADPTPVYEPFKNIK